MSTTVLMRRTLAGKLEPVDEVGREAMEHVKGVVSVEIKKPRNLGHHRKLFALLSLILPNQTRYATTEELLCAIKVYAGLCVPVQLGDGTMVRVPKSISFASMDQTEFEAFWDRVVKVVCERIIPGLKRADLERELLEIVQ